MASMIPDPVSVAGFRARTSGIATPFAFDGSGHKSVVQKALLLEEGRLELGSGYSSVFNQAPLVSVDAVATLAHHARASVLAI